jgi:NADP-dependent 3-hydroxy acid dehydrogenase YdfG
MKNIIVITGASSGFGALAARALAIRWEEVQQEQWRTLTCIGKPMDRLSVLVRRGDGNQLIRTEDY